MWIQRPSSVALVLLAVALLAPISTSGQEPPQPVVNLQFNFSDPGARSLGFGGAFIGLADDATAAFANPAGLVQLGKPEVSIEVRQGGAFRTYFGTLLVIWIWLPAWLCSTSSIKA